MTKILKYCLTAALLIAPLSACVTAQDSLNENVESQVALRAMQTRSFDTTDKKKVMQGALATLQDLSFVIDNADYDIGTITATKLSRYGITMTISVRPNNEEQMLVRAVARYGDRIVQEPRPYQSFFASLAKGLFLDANLVDGE